MPDRTNLAGRAGRTSAARWRRTTVLWFAGTIAAMAVGSAIGLNVIGDSQTGSGESGRATAMLAAANFKAPALENVLVQSRDGQAVLADPAFTSAVASLVQTLAVNPWVTNIRSPLEGGAASGLVSKDGRSALVQFDVRGDADKADKHIQAALDAVAGTQQANPSFRIEEFGMASANHQLSKVLSSDFRRAEYTSLPITLVILFLAFGALVAAAIPVLLAFTAVLGSIGLYVLVSHVYPSPNFVDSVILMMGMAVGVDYSLFYVQRAREERRSGADIHRALLTAAATSGQAVLISGATVLIAMSGMIFAGNTIFTSMGLGTMVVVFVAMVGSVTVLPALLNGLGDRVDRGRLPRFGRSRDRRVWEAILRPALSHPGLAAAGAAGLLAVTALPVLTLHTKLPSFTDLPNGLPTVQTFKRITAAFPGSPAPADVVVRAPDVTRPAIQQALHRLESEALASRQMGRPMSIAVSPDRTVASLHLSLAGTGDNGPSMRALALLRNHLTPSTIGQVDGVEVAVTGMTAATKDFNDLMKQRLPIVFAFVLSLAFLLLLVTFRSVVVPLTAICLNLLSVAAAYGVLVLVFQHTWAQGLLGFTSNGGITSWLPMFLFVVLFGLSMDYHVFIVSRIKELVDRGEPTDAAVLHGISRTAGSVTSAAVVMVAVFGIFATLSLLQFKQMGFGLAVAIAVDATVVRAVLLPATMKLLGDWNWYLPQWLEWLPSLSAHEGRPAQPGRGAQAIWK